MQWCETLTCTYGFFLDWQTLIAGMLALAAALFALIPVYRQLHQTRIQMAITSREVLLDRVEKTERRRTAVQLELGSITNNFLAAIYPYDPEAEPTINEHWAFEAVHTVRGAIEKLQRQQISRSDTQLIDDRRAVVIQHAVALRDCLDDIHRAASVSLDDEEFTEEQVRDATDYLDKAAEVAKKSLDKRIRELEARAKELDQAFDASLSQHRDRIRRINEIVLANDY